MKIFKKLVTLCAAITLAFGVGASLAACDKEESSSSSSESSSVATTVSYDFELALADGSPAKDYQVQICTADNSLCLTPVTTDAEGKASVEVSAANQDKEFVIHVMYGGTQLKATEYRVDTAGVTPIPAGYNGDTIKITVLK